MENLNGNIITIIGTLGGIIVGGFITFIVNDISEQKKFKREIYFSNKEKIDLAYKEVYSYLLELKQYYYLFVEDGNEYKASVDYKSFSPLNNLAALISCIEKNELYLNQLFLKRYEKLLEKTRNHSNIALQLTINPDLITEDYIEGCSKEAITNIENFMNFIKERFKEKI